MKFIAVITLIWLLLSVHIASAETIVRGPVSGDWTVEGSPYVTNWHIRVPEGDTLRIHPGVTVEFRDGTKFNVEGSLIVQGTEEDSVFIHSAQEE